MRVRLTNIILIIPLVSFIGIIYNSHPLFTIISIFMSFSFFFILYLFSDIQKWYIKGLFILTSIFVGVSIFLSLKITLDDKIGQILGAYIWIPFGAFLLLLNTYILLNRLVKKVLRIKLLKIGKPLGDRMPRKNLIEKSQIKFIEVSLSKINKKIYMFQKEIEKESNNLKKNISNMNADIKKGFGSFYSLKNEYQNLQKEVADLKILQEIGEEKANALKRLWNKGNYLIAFVLGFLTDLLVELLLKLF